MPWLLDKATFYFNRYIRERDAKVGCISCGSYSGVMHAGHFFSAGHHAAVRFDERNVNKQCLRCNNFLHGNLLPYRDNLIKKIGQKSFNDLEQTMKYYKRVGYKHDRILLIEIIENYKIKYNQIAA